jgi:hypothetical protein
VSDKPAGALTPEESGAFLRALPGYPFLPCRICGFTGSCDHIGWERARAWHPGLTLPQTATTKRKN